VSYEVISWAVDVGEHVPVAGVDGHQGSGLVLIRDRVLSGLLDVVRQRRLQRLTLHSRLPPQHALPLTRLLVHERYDAARGAGQPLLVRRLQSRRADHVGVQRQLGCARECVLGGRRHAAQDGAAPTATGTEREPGEVDHDAGIWNSCSRIGR
jgi:hypothetical protein